MADIKTRSVDRGTIKTFDRSLSSSHRIRNAASEIKEVGRSGIQTQEDSANEYATNRIQGGMNRGAQLTERGAEKAGNKSVKTIQKAMKDRHFKNSAKNTIKKKAINSSIRQRGNAQAAKGAKQAGKQSAKAMQKTFKASAKASVKTTKAAARGVRLIARGIVTAVKALAAATKALIAAIAAGGWIAVVIIIVCCLFGAAFYCFGDSSSNSYIPVSKEVEAYDPLIREYAKKYDIGEYTELIKAVMMQESGGKGNDPMQASESGYNTKYPRKPNGITRPEYSIDCGVHALSACLKEAKCKNPIDMEHIRLALQGYNYGNGYIAWAVKRDGGYTVENAEAFSNEQAKKHGWSSYGDKQYVSHVLRYYPFGNYNYGIGNGVITKIAASQIGNKGGAPYWSWYGFKGRVEWCACFVSWCANEGGYIQSGIIPKFSGCGDGANWFKTRGQWQSRSYKPSAGDIIFFDWDGNGTPNHVGIVEKCDGRTVTTIEGNSGDACKRRTYSVGASVIYGYGVPTY